MNDTQKSGVGALFVSLDTHRILLSIRSPYKTHALSWALFGGMCEYSESPKDALLRELSEEMGFLPDIEKIYPFDTYHSDDNRFVYHSFVCLTETEFIPTLNHENCGYCWLDLGQWPRPLHQGIKSSFCSAKSLKRLRLIIESHSLTSNTISKSPQS